MKTGAASAGRKTAVNSETKKGRKERKKKARCYIDSSDRVSWVGSVFFELRSRFL